MAKAGLPLPAEAPARLPAFSRVLADIGGEQSLTANLSTFSGHLKRIHRSSQQLLQPFADASAIAPLPTRDLHLESLTADSAVLLVSAFPCLQRLELELAAQYRWTRQPWSDTELVAALDVLLNPDNGARQLTDLSLQPRWQAMLTPALAAALSAGTRLQRLGLAFGLYEPDQVAPLACLTALQSLGISECEPGLLAPLLCPLTGLTSLKLGSTEALLPLEHLASLRALSDLEAWFCTLDLDTLSRLESLRELLVGGLVLPSNGLNDHSTPGPSEAWGSGATWQLPSQLSALYLCKQAPEVLHALRASPLRLLTWDLNLELQRGTHYDEASGGLTEFGEVALSSAAGFLAGRMDGGSCIRVKPRDLSRLLPVGGVEEAGPGRRDHTAWLEALGRAGVPSLVLDGVDLEHADLEALARHAGLKVLDLPNPGPAQPGSPLLYPLDGLLPLSCAPGLETLALGIDLWCDEEAEEEADPLRLAAGARAVLLELLSASQPRLSVRLSFSDPRCAGAEFRARLQGVVAGLREELEAAKVDPARLSLDADED
ncbi:hypothetical protein HYH03_013861 [Edaphochlamys debaryana]|uniref:Uncharacterized protein n=1 Tax=Edaphochlamys debaryana TaxID=47281 RepID=A0A835XQ96_9CHLO|nr:hypothetical protein HYH03_013861 [Edaphochlamys debaryana]|eukprot:KAG2487582.1 hypothetical protein HYH03_013861 [Edaphochlamys debaryana]